MVVALIISLYFWTALSSPPSPVGIREGGYYQNLAASLVDGHLHLLEQPDPRLLALPDPYDPAANKALRLHDASLYQGQYYVYFGITPVIVLFLPAEVLGIPLSEPVAGALFAALALVFAALLIGCLLRRYANRAPPWVLPSSVLAVGLANGLPFLLRRSSVYEIAIAAGLCFTTLTVALALRAAFNSRHRTGCLAAAWLTTGLAAGCRPHLVVVGVVVAWATYRAVQEAPRGGGWKLAATTMAPLIAVLAGLALYNASRFGSPLEFGTRYQLTAFNITQYNFFDPARVVPGLFFYLFQPPHFSLTFPFITLAPEWPGGGLPSSYFDLEPVGGALALAPWLLVGPIGGAAAWARGKARTRSAGKLVLLLTATGAAIAVPPMILFGTATQRYAADWLTLGLIGAVLMLAVGVQSVRARGRGWRQISAVAVATAFLYSSVVGLALGITGYYEGLRHGSPRAYKALEDVFAFIPLTASRLQSKPVLQRVEGVADGEYQIQWAQAEDLPVIVDLRPSIAGALPGTRYAVNVALAPEGSQTHAQGLFPQTTPLNIRSHTGLIRLVVRFTGARAGAASIPSIDSTQVAVTYALP